jgi:peroxiredoxin
MSRLFYLFILSFIVISKGSFATTIFGSDSSYAGVEIVLLRPADPFTGKEKELARTIVNKEGTFSIEFTPEETTWVYAYVGIYKTHLYVEQGKTYEVIFPARKDKTNADRLNPFFKYIESHLAVVNQDKDDLNMQIRMFDNSFFHFYAKHTEKVFNDDVEFEQLDKDIDQLDKPYSKSKHIYFNEYRKYKYGLLRFVAYQHKSKNVSDMYFKNQSFRENNPAFVELFNKVYEGYFSYFNRTQTGKQLGPAISGRSYSEVCRVLALDEVLQPEELLNMVLLKSLHEEFYDDNYSRSAMLALLDSMLLVNENSLVKSSAESIREKVTKLLPGHEPPYFELYDIDSNLVKLSDFKGKFVYLNFCSCFSYTCINEFVMLHNLYRKHNKYLEIVTIVIDDDLVVVKDFVERSGYPWKFLQFDNQPEIFQQYDVRVFPTYYLIDNEGKLSMSPAPAPAEEFEGRLFKVLRARGVL